jgi:hypothetical protein
MLGCASIAVGQLQLGLNGGDDVFGKAILLAYAGRTSSGVKPTWAIMCA